jgi:DNA transformation protein and related proteins
MPKRSEYVEHVVETLRGFGAVEVKPMFGGWGLYHERSFFALVFDDTLYLKTDAENRAEFDAQGLEPFVFQQKDGDTILTSYCRAPADALESPEVMAEWARRGYAAALRAAAKKRPGKARAKKGGVGKE